MSKLRVRMYNVRFGDAILVSVPDKAKNGKETMRHILIDMGNLLNGKEGADDVFEAVLDNVIEEVGTGRELDLFVMTHEHLDHAQGLLYCSVEHGKTIKAKHAWLTASAEPTYYDTHEKAKEKKMEAEAEYRRIRGLLQAAPGAGDERLDGLLAINNRHLGAGEDGEDTRSTTDCVDFLRTLAPEKKTHYVHRETDLEGKHPFKEAKLALWAPEEDTSDYYGKFVPLALASVPVGTAADGVATPPEPPPGVDPQAFKDLVAAMGAGMAENIRAIDEAANNTSIVLSLEWRGWRLLFPGDAERRSWKTIWRELKNGDELGPVDFLKVSHHGSETGIPFPEELVERLFPRDRPDGPIPAVVSHYPTKAFAKIPADEQMSEVFDGRCELHYVFDECPEDRPWLDYEFEAKE
jgi:hypothetical protein